MAGRVFIRSRACFERSAVESGRDGCRGRSRWWAQGASLLSACLRRKSQIESRWVGSWYTRPSTHGKQHLFRIATVHLATDIACEHRQHRWAACHDTEPSCDATMHTPLPIIQTTQNIQGTQIIQVTQITKVTQIIHITPSAKQRTRRGQSPLLRPEGTPPARHGGPKGGLRRTYSTSTFS